MRLLLTSAGITNPSIHAALVDLLGRPIAEADALVIPTASYAQAQGPERALALAAGREPDTPMTELGWRSIGLLELTALPSLTREHWLPWVHAADVLLVGGGDPLFLHHWLRGSGLAEELPGLRDTLWVGLSAGSMALTPRIGPAFVEWTPPGSDPDDAVPIDTTLGIVDFAIFPHLDNPDLPHNTLPTARRWAAGLGCLAYVIDDATALVVRDGDAGSAVEVVSEGTWHRLDP